MLNENGEAYVNAGCLDVLGEAFWRYEKETYGDTGSPIQLPLDRNLAVTRALARSKDGKRLFSRRRSVMYPGLMGVVNSFRLRNEYQINVVTGE